MCRLVLSSKEKPAGELRAEILPLAFPETNAVVISSIKQASADSPLYNVASEENKGYGFMLIALAFAKTLARREGITTISITPYCAALGEYYKKFGFHGNPNPAFPGNIHKLILAF
ncbi:MAG: hypothetical protein QXH30_02500 [Candidatus Bilamarchaeaceae archaeon]